MQKLIDLESRIFMGLVPEINVLSLEIYYISLKQALSPGIKFAYTLLYIAINSNLRDQPCVLN